MKCKIIAEIGQNHDGDIDKAKQLIKSAKKAGADIAKFQLFDAKQLFQKENNEWYEYNCAAELTFEEARILNDYCSEVDIEFMASAFDTKRIEWLEALNVKRHKIASRSINDNLLIESISATKKEVIISLGHWQNKHKFPVLPGISNARFLHCISKYPTELTDIGFNDVCFNQYSGFSDHTIGTTACKVAIARGAKIIEKHFTNDHNAYGPDHRCSANEEELKTIVDFKNDFEASL